jgi:osmotically-inducible protein OsmY
MSDREIAARVEAALFSELRVDDEEISASVDRGTVTLRGTVGSLGAKLAASRAARRVQGVRAVVNELDVRMMNHRLRDDAELRGRALRALASNAAVPRTVDALVDTGLVVLIGTVDSRFQREEAAATVRTQLRLGYVDNRILVRLRSA